MPEIKVYAYYCSECKSIINITEVAPFSIMDSEIECPVCNAIADLQ